MFLCPGGGREFILWMQGLIVWLAGSQQCSCLAKCQLMNDTIPWRGAREKHPKFMQILIQSLTKEGDIVVSLPTKQKN